ncbi:interleukin-6 receptor subunit alpha [Archocentrus centrarchus]|uniref:interleukin-6 receptor subunit alpha n=1 Tax=Archocentrus centrarchus TaxID=63155 RepID=UPI0011EA3B5D|nr:uncharacterized protein LOC115793903 [Archocentrus centrarchus]
MGIFLLLLIFSPVRGTFEGTCPRKDPPPGVLVLSPGSKLVLTCGGHVKVDGVKFSLTGSSAGINKRESSSNATPAPQNDIHNSAVSVKNDNSSTKNAVIEPGENKSLIYTDAGYTASPHTVGPTRTTRSLKDEFKWTTEEMDVQDDYEEDEEGEGASRVTRGIKLRPEWTWNKMTVGKGNRDWGAITFGRSGSALSLASVRPTDSGRYACHHRGKEKFGVKVIVAESPESPKLYCYKKSPSSKIRCEGTPQKAFIEKPTCYLLLNKSPKEKFKEIPCSYSIQQSRCWCALDHNYDELSTFYMAYMCVTSITANVTSDLMIFRPLDILKPDPPSNVAVRQVLGQERRLKVSWNLPTSWKMQDRFFKLIYAVKYYPVKPSLGKEWVIPIEDRRSETITDIVPGDKYLIQVRTKDEFDGHWSDWSTPVYARSWTKKPPPPSIVSVVEEKEQEMTVTWSLSTNLTEQHNLSFIYEIKYWLVNFPFYNEEVKQFEGKCSYTITDAIPDVEYLIQLRFKKEHDSQWSDWSVPFHARNIIVTHLMDNYAERLTGPEGSGGDYNYNNSGTGTSSNVKWVHHVLWIFSLFILLCVILANHIFRDKDRLISKFHSLYFTTHCGDSSQPLPAVPTAPEGVAFLPFVPPKSNKEHPPTDEKESEENEEQEILREKTEVMHFNNTSYFFVQRE